jgi:carbon-monoxide dehydrogenase medium subunit
VAARDFFVGFLETALAPDEMLVEVRVPVTGDAGWSYQKFTRRAQDWAIVGSVAVARPAGGAAVALVNMGSRPLRADAVEQALVDGASAADAARLAAVGTEPSADLHASTDYRQHLARVLTGRALAAAGIA